MKRPKRSEAEIGVAITAWLEKMGWDCYPEVQVGTGARRADIVAIRGPLLWVIECKVSFGFPVLDQAARWYGQCHYLSVAVLHPRRPAGVAQAVIDRYGIGIFGTREVRTKDSYRSGETGLRGEEVRPPRLNRSAHECSQLIRRSLHPDQKQYAAGGTAESGFSSPWRRTMDAAKHIIRHNSGCTVKYLLDHIDHHYTSAKTAKQCIPQWLESDPDVRVEIEGRVRRFYLKKEE